MNYVKNSKIRKSTIPYSPNQQKKRNIKKNVNNNHQEHNNLLKFADYNFNKKPVQRNQSSIIKKPDNTNLPINKNYYDQKQIMKKIKYEKNVGGLNLNSKNIFLNKSINDSYKKGISNKSTINRNKSLNQILISDNKKKKSKKITSSMEKKVNSYLIPKFPKPKTISNSNTNNNQNYRINNPINQNTNNNLDNKNVNNKLFNIPSNKMSLYNNNKLSEKYNQHKSKDNSFDNYINDTKKIKIKDNNLKYKYGKDISNNENLDLNYDIINNKKIYPNSLIYNNFFNENIESQKRNKTMILQKDSEFLKSEPQNINSNENEKKKELELKNSSIKINGKIKEANNNINLNNNNYSIEVNKKEKNKNEVENKDITQKINNIIQDLKLGRKQEFFNKYKNLNNEDIDDFLKKTRNGEEKTRENMQNIRNNELLKNSEFKSDNNNNLNIINKNEKLENLINHNLKNINNDYEKKNNLEMKNEIKSLYKENKTYVNLSNKCTNLDLKMNVLNSELNGNSEKLKLNNNLDNIEESFKPKTYINRIQNYNKYNINISNSRLNSCGIKKINLDNIRGNYQSKIDLNKIKDKEENIINSITQSLIGLVNLGETCYMSTGLQNIIHCVPFITQLFSVLDEFRETIEQKIITYSFVNLCISLIKNEKYNKFSINSFDPSNFRKNFCKIHKEYANHEQHDSLEFLRVLLDDISKELNQTKIICDYKELKTEGKSKKEQNYDYNNFYLCRENSIIVKTFYSQIMNIFTCNCGDISYSFEKILDIPLLFPKGIINNEVNLNDLLYLYFNGEKISWSLPCQKCGQKNVERSKKIKLSILPEVIIFSLQRFNPVTGVKINTIIKFEEIIDLKPFCDNDFFNGEINTKYKLFGISNHSGTINFGHYYSYIKVGEQWYDFNDSFVKPINLFLMSRAAYFFFYSRGE